MRANFGRMFTNLASVLTVNDPPRFDVYALPVMTGALVAVLSMVGVAKLRDLPAAAVLFFASAIAASFVVGSFAYPGRFSVHLPPITSALTVCAIARITGTTTAHFRSPEGPPRGPVARLEGCSTGALPRRVTAYIQPRRR